jgi:hypothetical protein
MAFTFDIDGLKLVMSNGAYRSLTDNGLDTIAQMALDTAEIVVNAKFDLAGETPDWTDQTVIRAGLCYAVYELYSRVENEIIAKDKWSCGNGLLSSIIGAWAYFDPGNVKKEIEVKVDNIRSVFVVEEGTDDWNGFGGFDD